MSALDRIETLCSAGDSDQAREFARGVCSNQSPQQITVDSDELEVTVETRDFIGTHSIRMDDGPVISKQGTYRPKRDALNFTFRMRTVKPEVERAVEEQCPPTTAGDQNRNVKTDGGPMTETSDEPKQGRNLWPF